MASKCVHSKLIAEGLYFASMKRLLFFYEAIMILIISWILVIYVIVRYPDDTIVSFWIGGIVTVTMVFAMICTAPTTKTLVCNDGIHPARSLKDIIGINSTLPHFIPYSDIERIEHFFVDSNEKAIKIHIRTLGWTGEEIGYREQDVYHSLINMCASKGIPIEKIDLDITQYRYLLEQ